MKQEKLCIRHIPSFFIGEPEYKVVSEKECKICVSENKKESIKK